MTQFNYNRNIPFATNSPSVDQPNMQTNTNSTDDLISVDHNSFNVPNGGYHKIIHQVPETVDPIAVPGIGQIYTKTMTIGNTDQVLFFESGGGRITQLTGIIGGSGNQTSATANGYTPLTGGMILQWGLAAIGAGSHVQNNINFNFIFPNNCFFVNATLKPSGGSQSNLGTISINAIATDKFNFVYNGTSNAYPNFYWMAIGN